MTGGKPGVKRRRWKQARGLAKISARRQFYRCFSVQPVHFHAWHLAARHWALIVFVASALYVNLRGTIRFNLLRALTSLTVVLAPFNALMYLFSRVPSTPYIDAARFAELSVLRDNWQVIRDEALKLNDEGYIRAAATYNDIGFNSFFRTGWRRFYLKWYGVELPSARAFCPRTVALLSSIPTVKAAMFASLPPGARLVRHRDPYAGSLRYHLGLATPNSPDCYIVVDGERYFWKDGEATMFDETFIHYAENRTDRPRVVLFCDVERPLRFAPVRWLNRVFARVVMTASATQNVDGERVGAINKAFLFLYRIRLQAKKLKNRNKPVYYAGKWLLIAALVYLLFV